VSQEGGGVVLTFRQLLLGPKEQTLPPNLPKGNVAKIDLSKTLALLNKLGVADLPGSDTLPAIKQQIAGGVKNVSNGGGAKMIVK